MCHLETMTPVISLIKFLGSRLSCTKNIYKLNDLIIYFLKNFKSFKSTGQKQNKTEKSMVESLMRMTTFHKFGN